MLQSGYEVVPWIFSSRNTCESPAFVSYGLSVSNICSCELIDDGSYAPFKGVIFVISIVVIRQENLIRSPRGLTFFFEVRNDVVEEMSFAEAGVGLQEEGFFCRADQDQPIK